MIRTKDLRIKTAEGYLRIAKRIRDDIKTKKKDRKQVIKLISRIEKLLSPMSYVLVKVRGEIKSGQDK